MFVIIRGFARSFETPVPNHHFNDELQFPASQKIDRENERERERERGKTHPLGELVWNVVICALWFFKLLQKRRRANTGHRRRCKWKRIKIENYVICGTSLLFQQEDKGAFKKDWVKTWTHFAMTVYTSNTTCQRQLKLQQKLEKLPQQQSTTKVGMKVTQSSSVPRQR